MSLNPTHFGLHNRVILEELDANHIAIVKMIKSRIIRKDAIKIIEIAEKIRSTHPNIKVSLIYTSNICSKSKTLLNENNMEVIIRA